MSRRRTRLPVILVALMVAFGAPGPAAAAPVRPLHPLEGLAVDPPPPVTAATWILYDATYDLVLASNGADEERPMASTTKIMTGIVAFENSTPDQTVVVSQTAADVGEAEVPLVAGEQLRIGALTTGLLVRSANDAAIAVAEGVAGSVDAFVDMMNAKADELGLAHTRFTNPHGLDEPGHHTSAADLLTMARAAMQIPEFAHAVRAHVYRFPPDPEGEFRVVENTNLMLWEYPGTIGVKTGYTFQAGLVLAAAAERDGRTIYAVVMGSEGDGAHFADATALLDYGFDSFGVVPLIIEGDTYGFQRTASGVDPLLAAGTVEAFVHIAGAGLFSPQLELADGEPVLVVGEEQLEVPVASSSEHLPDLTDALGWFSRWFGDES